MAPVRLNHAVLFVADLERCACREIRPCRSVGVGGERSSSGMLAAVLVRLAYLAVSQVFAALWLLRMTNREKDIEILVLRHQIAVRHGTTRRSAPRLRSEDRALPAALLVPVGLVKPSSQVEACVHSLSAAAEMLHR